MKIQEAIDKMMEIEGMDYEGLLDASYDSVNPGICLNCEYSMDIEPDCSDGLCPDCGQYKIISSTMLIMSVV